MLMDIVFSLDSVITAIGMARRVPVMVMAIIIAVIFMMVSAGKISSFIERNPTIKMLALSFLILIGVALIGEGLGFDIPKGYIYFAMGFSVFVETLNIRARRHQASSGEPMAC
jgi:predicted tellurium resistance membrane protein TerC